MKGGSNNITPYLILPFIGTILFLSSSLKEPSSEHGPFLIYQDTVETCISCHGELLETEETHSPAKKDCERCHITNGNNHPDNAAAEFSLAAEVPDLCYQCHDPKNEYDFVHDPVGKGDCMTCHSPHGTDYLYLVKADPVSTLCYECHDLGIGEDAHIHGAVEEGQCQGCHNPHQADIENLLNFEPPTLCRSCHRETRSQLRLEHQHAPFGENCFNCHQPHASKEPHLSDLPVKDLCQSCHEEFFNNLNNATHQHGALEDVESCLECHTPHASEHEKVLKADNTTLCLNCHSEIMETETGEIANIGKLIDDNEYVHSPINDKGCISCHTPHASEQQPLLTAAFPTGNYAPAREESFDLCLDCHDKNLFFQAEADTTMRFRDGDTNLHFVHINGEKGRNCNLCHNVHAAGNPHLVNSSTKFGNWDMPVRFTFREEGGSCATGCHSERSYSRK